MHDWINHNVPFMALMAIATPPNRPLLTRLAEQSIVGILAAAITMYSTLQRQQDSIDRLTETLKTERIETRAAIDRINQRIEQIILSTHPRDRINRL